jgi:hypothetical protein
MRGNMDKYEYTVEVDTDYPEPTFKVSQAHWTSTKTCNSYTLRVPKGDLPALFAALARHVSHTERLKASGVGDEAVMLLRRWTNRPKRSGAMQTAYMVCCELARDLAAALRGE